jgi:hypothetical protein
VSKIAFGFWTQFASDYSVVWDYDKTTNSYKRINGGQPHVDKNTGKQLETKNVIVVLADESLANDGYEGGQHLLYKLEGTGKAIVFHNGEAIEATWKKKDPETRMRWYDSSNKEISLVRGQIWVEVLPTGNKVKYGDSTTVVDITPEPTKAGAKKTTTDIAD